MRFRHIWAALNFLPLYTVLSEASERQEGRNVKRSGARLTRARIEEGVELALAESRDLVLWCVEPIGFGCRIRQSGAASFIFQYRVRGGRRAPVRKLTLGKLGALSLEAARAQARDYAQAAARGEDPQRDKLSARAQPTVRELFERWRADEGRRLSPRTIANAASHLRNQLTPFAAAQIDTIRKTDVARLHSALGAAPYAANRAMATLSALFAYAERCELLPSGANPVRGLRRYPERERTRMLDADEISSLWGALIDAQAEERHRFAAPAIMLGMLTGWRVGEVRTLAWERVELAERQVLLMGKTGARRAPAPESAVKLLAYLADAARHYGRGAHRGVHVFPALAGKDRERGPMSDWEHNRTWRAVVAAAGLSDVRRHDLRHLIAGVIAAQTGSALRVKEAMGHRSVAMSERYIAPIPALQRRSTEQAAALVLAFAEGEAGADALTPATAAE